MAFNGATVQQALLGVLNMEHRDGALFHSFALSLLARLSGHFLSGFFAAFSLRSSIAWRIVFLIHKFNSLIFLFVSCMEALYVNDDDTQGIDTRLSWLSTKNISKSSRVSYDLL